MNHTETTMKAVYLLEALINSVGAPAEFRPQFLADRMGGAATTIGQVQGKIVQKLRSRGFNVEYVERQFRFKEPLTISDLPCANSGVNTSCESNSTESEAMTFGETLQTTPA